MGSPVKKYWSVSQRSLDVRGRNKQSLGGDGGEDGGYIQSNSVDDRSGVEEVQLSRKEGGVKGEGKKQT